MSFSKSAETALGALDAAHKLPFGSIEPLNQSMNELSEVLRSLKHLKGRAEEIVWSAGKSNWSHVPWIAFLNPMNNPKKTTQEGVYAVILISKDLKRLYFCLGLGVTGIESKAKLENGGVRKAIKAEANYIRTLASASALDALGFELNLEPDLGSTASLPTKFKLGVVAHKMFEVSDLPSDDVIGACLCDLINAADGVLLELDKARNNELMQCYNGNEAVFLEQQKFSRIVEAWRRKKNLILQGPPGVGKSFIAKYLAYTLMGAKDTQRVEAIQFHQSYGYEDFVQGYRPDGSGGFARRDGSFFRFCSNAMKEPERPFVFIIDEINRGNLSKIFGELMLLIEADKRSPEWALQLSYAQEGEPRFYVPDNVFLIGMMNTADRSLSMVDYALRRRFAFVTIEPQFSSPNFKAILIDCGIPQALIDKIITKMNELNNEIDTDHLNLGEGYRIGHSFFVPRTVVDDPLNWYQFVIDTEIRPLLEEYWFDDRNKAEKWVERLIAD